jgi:hypothetical protein
VSNRENMKNLTVIGLFSLIITFSSCDKDIGNGEFFYNTEYRKGRWINSIKTDTLEFIDGSNLIRKGFAYTYGEYLYRIDNNILYISLPSDLESETQHPILNVDSKSVKLDNIYITNGTGDNSETYYKELH